MSKTAQTPVAWTSFRTGKKTGNHGIFSFAMRKRGTYEREIVGQTLWGPKLCEGF